MPFDFNKLTELGVGAILAVGSLALLWFFVTKALPEASRLIANAMQDQAKATNNLAEEQRRDRRVLRKWLSKQELAASERHDQLMRELSRPKALYPEGSR